MKHDIKTIRDILESVNENNVDNFLVDFSCWLKILTADKGLLKNFLCPETSQYFQWIDDGKHNANINFKK